MPSSIPRSANRMAARPEGGESSCAPGGRPEGRSPGDLAELQAAAGSAAGSATGSRPLMARDWSAARAVSGLVVDTARRAQDGPEPILRSY